MDGKPVSSALAELGTAQPQLVVLFIKILILYYLSNLKYFVWMFLQIFQYCSALFCSYNLFYMKYNSLVLAVVPGDLRIRIILIRETSNYKDGKQFQYIPITSAHPLPLPSSTLLYPILPYPTLPHPTLPYSTLTYSSLP